jgi:hypothetical protein
LKFVQDKIERRAARWGEVSDELLPILEKEMLKLRKQSDEISRKIASLEVTETETVAPILNWWKTVRPQLVKAVPLQWGEEQSIKQPVVLSERNHNRLKHYLHGQPGRCWAHFTEDGQIFCGPPESQASGLDKDGFPKVRILEMDGNDNVYQWVDVEYPVHPVVFCKPGAFRELLHKMGLKVKLYWKPKGQRYLELDRGRIEAEIEYGSSVHDNSVSHRLIPRGLFIFA